MFSVANCRRNRDRNPLVHSLTSQQFTHLGYMAHHLLPASTLFAQVGLSVLPYTPAELRFRHPPPFFVPGCTSRLGATACELASQRWSLSAAIDRLEQRLAEVTRKCFTSSATTATALRPPGILIYRGVNLESLTSLPLDVAFAGYMSPRGTMGSARAPAPGGSVTELPSVISHQRVIRFKDAAAVAAEKPSTAERGRSAAQYWMKLLFLVVASTKPPAAGCAGTLAAIRGWPVRTGASRQNRGRRGPRFASERRWRHRINNDELTPPAPLLAPLSAPLGSDRIRTVPRVIQFRRISSLGSPGITPAGARSFSSLDQPLPVAVRVTPEHLSRI